MSGSRIAMHWPPAPLSTDAQQGGVQMSGVHARAEGPATARRPDLLNTQTPSPVGSGETESGRVGTMVNVDPTVPPGAEIAGHAWEAVSSRAGQVRPPPPDE